MLVQVVTVHLACYCVAITVELRSISAEQAGSLIFVCLRTLTGSPPHDLQVDPSSLHALLPTRPSFHLKDSELHVKVNCESNWVEQ